MLEVRQILSPRLHLFREEKLISTLSPSPSPPPPLHPYSSQKINVDWSVMVYSGWKFILFLVFGRMTSNFMCLTFSNLRSRSLESCYHFLIVRKSSIAPGNHKSVLEKPCSRWCVSLNNLNKPHPAPHLLSPASPLKSVWKIKPLRGPNRGFAVYNMIYDIIVFENVRFRTSTRKQKERVFKNLHAGERFWKDSFSVTASPDTCGRWVKPGGGKYPFSKKNGLVWTGPKSFWIEKQRHWAVTLSYKEWPFCIFPIF